MSISQQIKEIIESVLSRGTSVDVTAPENVSFGHYSTSVALKLAQQEKKSPHEVAGELMGKIQEIAPAGFFEKLEVAGAGFINFWLSKEALLREFQVIVGGGMTYFELLSGKRILVEYTDPNPFKEFHIGHLMTNTIGEALARILEAAGAEVFRVNYQGDVGLHVAKSVWGMMRLKDEMPQESVPLHERAQFLGRAYAIGAQAYEEDENAKKEIQEINKDVYNKSDDAINKLYDVGRKWSLDYFETLYARLGTTFVHYFFESEAGPEGLAIVRDQMSIFKESQGAIIFPGEEYGLHNRVFINSAGLPTYEAKELGMNKKKFELYHPDLSLIVTGNEISDYFHVLLKAMSLVMPEVASKTKHLGHGMLRLAIGKMSSRTGNVVTAESLIDEVKQAVAEKLEAREEISEGDREEIKEKVAIAAIRYSILKQGIGSDVVFDKEKSIAFHGDSGPYIQYAYARLRTILRKAGEREEADMALLESQEEFALIKKILDFSDEVSYSAKELVINNIAKYLVDLAGLASRYYESTPILSAKGGSASGGKEIERKRRNARLALIECVAATLKNGLVLLGIEAPEQI